MVDYDERRTNLPGGVRIDPAQFNREGTFTVTMAAAASAGATSLTVDPLPDDLRVGDILDFTGAGEFAKVTTAAAEGEETVAVEALDAGIEDGDTATVIGAGVKTIPAGTVIGRTNAERDADTAFGPADDADDEVFILVNTIQDADINADAEVMRRGAGIKVNLFPGWDNLSAAIQTALADKYELTRGRG